MNALFTKPAQSVAPMLVVYALKMYGYEVDTHEGGGAVVRPEIWECMFNILVNVPLCLGVVQLFCWRFFTLKGKEET